MTATVATLINDQVGERVDMRAATVATTELLTALGVSLHEESRRDTPARMARAFAELLTPTSVDATMFANDAQYDDLVVQTGIPIASICEHHALPFIGTATVGYMPGDGIVGLSKIARVVTAFARGMQVQERLTRHIATHLHEQTRARGVGVIVRATHLCMAMRGASVPNVETVTRAMTGIVSADSAWRQEFLAMAGERG